MMMSNSEDRDLLRHLERIARVRPSAESTQRAMERVRAQLLTGSAKEAAQPRIIRLMSRPVVKLALAACLLVAMTATVVLYRGRSNGPSRVASTHADNPSAPHLQPIAPDLNGQLKQVEFLAANRDIAGLMGILDQSPLEAKVAAARELAKIGDPRPVETLARLARQWTGDPAANPFVESLDRLQKTLALASTTAQGSGQTSPAGSTTSQTAVLPVLSGLVTDAETGQPISGAPLQISGAQRFEVVTGSDGTYRLETVQDAGDYYLQVESNRYVALNPQDPCGLLALRPDSPIVRNIQLKRGCQISLEVVDEEGRPIKDVRLAASWLGSDQSNDVGQPALTSQDGTAVLGALNPSDVAYQIAAISQEYAPQRIVVTCSDPNFIDHLQMTLRKGTTVVGRAQYSDGTPAQGLQIYAMPDWWHSLHLPLASVVDTSGTFVLEHVEKGSFALRATIPQNNGLAYSFAICRAQLPPSQDQPLSVTIPSASITGKIRWSDSQRPAYVDVTAYCPAGTISHSRLQGDVDAFSLAGLRPGSYTLAFEGANVQEQVVEQVAAPSSNVEVSLEYVTMPKLRGIVLKAESGAPVDHFKVAMMKIRSWPGLIYLPEVQWHPVDDANGVFELPTEGPGLYEVQVSAEGFVPALFERVDTEQLRQLVVELSSGGRIKGRVVNVAGEPLTGATVTPLAGTPGGRPLANGLLVSEQTSVQSRDGEFTLEHVPAGLHDLRITHPEFSAATLEGIPVLEGKTTPDIMVTLHKGGAVEGTVFDAEGRPQANVTLTFQEGDAPYGPGQDEAGLLATVVTDEQGHYRVDRLPQTLCFIQRRHPETHLGVVQRAVWPMEGKTIQLDLGGRPNVTGVLALEGKPTATCQVLLSDPMRANSGLFQCRATTGSDGSFAFSGVPIGRYAVYYQTSADSQWIKTTTIDVAAEDLDLGILPKALSQVAVIFSGRGAASAADWTVQLREGDAFWGQRIGKQPAQEDPNVPHLITQVLAGSYMLEARSPDASRKVTRALTVNGQESQQEVVMEIPAGTASVSGAILNDIGPSLLLFSQDMTLSAKIECSNGYYRITGLPAGNYFVGSLYLLDKAPLARFRLAEGENKILDISTWTWSGANQGLLSVEVATSLGRPQSSATVWLEGPTGRIDPLIKTDCETILIAPAGKYMLHVSQKGFQPQQKEVTIQSNDLLALVPSRPVIEVILEPELSPSNEP
jgi:hypothetical protein